MGRDCELRADGVRKRMARVIFGPYPCIDNRAGGLAASIYSIRGAHQLWSAFVSPATQRGEKHNRDTAGKEQKMSEQMTKTREDAMLRFALHTKVVPMPPMTQEETDAAFDNASDAGEVYAAMKTRADEFKASDQPGREPRMAGAMTPDTDILWQGDVGVVLLSPETYAAMRLTPLYETDTTHVQVAIGSGIGARHLVSRDELDVLILDQPGVLDGPILCADKPWMLTHPEHQNVTFPPGRYAIRYQRQYAEDLRRAAD